MEKKVLLFLTDGFEEAEALVTADLLRRGGVSVVTASITGNKLVTGSHDITVTADALFGEAAEGAYDAVIIPGGPGTKNYFEHKELLAFIKKSGEDKNKLTAAICAAPSVLGSLGLLDGKRATCYPGYEDKLGEALFTGGPAVTDGNIITGRSAGCVFDFALEILKYLCGGETSEKIRAAIVYTPALQSLPA